MGKRGPPKTPTAILKLRASPRGERRRNEPVFEKTISTCPEWLDEQGKKVWRDAVPQLYAAGVLVRIDRYAFGCYCQYFSWWMEAREAAKAKGLTKKDKLSSHAILIFRLAERMLKIEREFGMTPAARASLAVEIKGGGNGKENSEDEKESYLNRLG